MDIDITLVQKCYDEFKRNQSSMQKYKNYYDGKHDILNNYAMVDSRSNMKLVFNFPRKMTTEEVGYILGKPVNYVSKSGNDEIISQIDFNISTWEKHINQELRKQAEIFGVSYAFDYIDSNGYFSETILNPLNCYVYTDENNNIVLGLHYFKKQFSDDEFLDVYSNYQIYHFKVNGGLLLLGQDTNLFETGIIECPCNTEKTCGYIDIISLVDAYNVINSDLVNEISDHRQSMLGITGGKIEEEDLAKMKSNGTIMIPENAKVEWIIKSINDNFVQNELKNIEDKIYDLMNTVNMNVSLASNTSGVALRSKLLALENRCSMKEAIFENVLRKRLDNLFYFLKIKTGKVYNQRDISIKFNRNVPQDLAMISQMCTQLSPIVSQESLLGQIPFVENPSLEIQKFNKEKENSMINFNNVPDVGGVA